MDKRVKVIISVGILIILGVCFYFASYLITKYTGYSITGKLVYSKDEKIQLGECLRDKGDVLYCSSLSIYCSTQKNILGVAFDSINYVDCTESYEECVDLRGIPAWKINNRVYYGIQSLNRLVELSGCGLRK